MVDKYQVARADANRRRSKNDEGGSSSIKADKTEMTETEKENLGSVAGKNLGAKEASSEGAPKQEPGESLGSFGERMRQYRERQKNKKSATMDQAGAALSRKLQ